MYTDAAYEALVREPLDPTTEEVDQAFRREHPQHMQQAD